ncbi:MAG: hypothetical protein E6K01_02080 [Methanobacteriota archaeon]|nr:MAG: hypothetical protein E6K01_02080 [Euryarchaeota archaeon]
MAQSESLKAHCVDDDSWRRELCPECGARLLGFPAWKLHGSRHGWGSDWFSARVRAGRPGEIIRVNPDVLGRESISLVVDTVEDATWKSGIPA